MVDTSDRIAFWEDDLKFLPDQQRDRVLAENAKKPETINYDCASR